MEATTISRGGLTTTMNNWETEKMNNNQNENIWTYERNITPTIRNRVADGHSDWEVEPISKHPWKKIYRERLRAFCSGSEVAGIGYSRFSLSRVGLGRGWWLSEEVETSNVGGRQLVRLRRGKENREGCRRYRMRETVGEDKDAVDC